MKEKMDEKLRIHRERCNFDKKVHDHLKTKLGKRVILRMANGQTRFLLSEEEALLDLNHYTHEAVIHPKLTTTSFSGSAAQIRQQLAHAGFSIEMLNQ